jgi:hypothetical protein
MRTVGDLATFAVRQERALVECESKRVGLVGIIDAAQPEPPWWEFWR